MDPAGKVDFGAVGSAAAGVGSIVGDIAAVVLGLRAGAPKPPFGPFLILWILGVALGIVAVILGILALRRIGRDPHLRRGSALAIGGIVLGGLGVLIFL
jgi:hypothetical protein